MCEVDTTVDSFPPVQCDVQEPRLERDAELAHTAALLVISFRSSTDHQELLLDYRLPYPRDTIPTRTTTSTSRDTASYVQYTRMYELEIDRSIDVN